MIKEVFQYVVAMREVKQLQIDGREYTDKKIYAVKPPTPAVVQVSTLMSVVDYFRENPDQLRLETLVVHVKSPTQVDVFSRIKDQWQNRASYISAALNIQPYPTDKYLPVELFIIYLQTYFVPSETIDKMIQLVSVIQHDKGIEVSDDGKTQKVVAKTGIVKMNEVELPNPVTLQPYRTFMELEQPEAKFLLRTRMGNNGPECALYDADGGHWQLKAVGFAKKWLNDKLPDGMMILA